MTVSGSTDEPSARLMFDVPADKPFNAKVFVRAEPARLDGQRTEFRFRLDTADGSETTSVGAVFEAPEKK